MENVLKPSDGRANKKNSRQPKPAWLRKRMATGSGFEAVRKLVKSGNLHTVCQEAHCPNIWECYSKRTATFMILGERCSRNCGFCAVAHGHMESPDPEEPQRVARAVNDMALDYAVITSVSRDDLPDGGAGHFARTIEQVREHREGIQIETLVPDFSGNPEAIAVVVKAHPDVLNHNMETVQRLYPAVRPQASYERSLEVFRTIQRIDAHMVTKSGMMLGLGERDEEIEETLLDLLAVGCQILTLGQYLQPTSLHLPVVRYLPPEEFDAWQERAIAMGFSQVASGPFVRSSYQAKQIYHKFQGSE